VAGKFEGGVIVPGNSESRAALIYGQMTSRPLAVCAWSTALTLRIFPRPGTTSTCCLIDTFSVLCSRLEVSRSRPHAFGVGTSEPDTEIGN